MALSEFDLIKHFFKRDLDQRNGIELGIGDDAAVVNVPAGQSLVMSMDTLVAGVHFPIDTPPDAIAYKALAVNLSDMAAMGAQPGWMLLGLTLPDADESWLAPFSHGLSCLADEYGVTLIGGDTTHGPLTITIQVNGLLPHGQALQRSGARAGDLIYVTGQLGDAGLGLKFVENNIDLDISPQRRDYFIQRLHRPTPRVTAGLALRGIATAAIDVSDGLLADLGHLVEASVVAATVNVEQLPIADELRVLSDEWWTLPLTAGDDYELCFTVAADNQAMVEKKLQEIDCPCYCIGRIEAGAGVKVKQGDETVRISSARGYQHFD